VQRQNRKKFRRDAPLLPRDQEGGRKRASSRSVASTRSARGGGGKERGIPPCPPHSFTHSEKERKRKERRPGLPAYRPTAPPIGKVKGRTGCRLSLCLFRRRKKGGKKIEPAVQVDKYRVGKLSAYHSEGGGKKRDPDVWAALGSGPTEDGGRIRKRKGGTLPFCSSPSDTVPEEEGEKRGRRATSP